MYEKQWYGFLSFGFHLENKLSSERERGLKEQYDGRASKESEVPKRSGEIIAKLHNAETKRNCRS